MKKIALLVGLAASLGFNNAQAVDWNWKGDIRYRYQSDLADYDSIDGENSRDRHRLRVRIGVYPWINEELSAGVQLSSGGTETTSRNESLDDAFIADTILLNEAFIDYHPMWFDGNVNIILGKRSVGSTLVTVNDLVWDSDLTFEGATLQYGKDGFGKEKDGLNAVAGYYFLKEEKVVSPDDAKDAYLFAGQLGYKTEVSDIRVMLGVGYYDYINFNKSYSSGNPFKNAVNYIQKDFNIVEIFGNVGGQITETLPWKITAQYAFNTASQADWPTVGPNTGIDDSKRDSYLVELMVGDAKQPGQWSLYGDYVYIERDAMTAFTDSDRFDGLGTDLEGFKIGLVYHLVQNLTLGFTYFNFQQIDVDSPRVHTFMADAVVKF
ncbi:MAG: hypothetical protein HGA62_04450 [Chlorobiaceae bacterium]|nr:hypothetical protein [Chlorobiaceae bacterium]NTV61522.1 hypothetical protein [Chlorobiaceae bacterium]